MDLNVDVFLLYFLEHIQKNYLQLTLGNAPSSTFLAIVRSGLKKYKYKAATLHVAAKLKKRQAILGKKRKVHNKATPYTAQ